MKFAPMRGSRAVPALFAVTIAGTALSIPIVAGAQPPETSASAPDGRSSTAASQDAGAAGGPAAEEQARADVLRAVHEFLAAWGRFAVSGDVTAVDPYLAEGSPQGHRMRADSPGIRPGSGSPSPYTITLHDPIVAVETDLATVTATVEWTRPGQAANWYRWQIELRRSATRWRIWTVRNADEAETTAPTTTPHEVEASVDDGAGEPATTSTHPSDTTPPGDRSAPSESPTGFRSAWVERAVQTWWPLATAACTALAAAVARRIRTRRASPTSVTHHIDPPVNHHAGVVEEPGDKEPPPSIPTSATTTSPTIATGSVVVAVDDRAGVGHEALTDQVRDVDVLARVMGDVTVERLHGPDGPLPIRFERGKACEAVVYLASRQTGAGVSIEDVEAALWPEGDNQRRTLNNTITSARRALGERDGHQYLPAAEAGSYHLSGRVTTDFQLFWNLRQHAEETTDPTEAAALLHQALTLVRGEPYLGKGRDYAWAGAVRSTIAVSVVDTADELGEIYLAVGDLRSADWAARTGLAAAPGEERLYRLLIRSAIAAGSRSTAARIYQELLDTLTEPGAGGGTSASEATTALYNQLMRPEPAGLR